MLSPADFLRLPYTPDLTEGGIEFALRSLSYAYERQGRSPYGRLRRLVANIAVEVAFRRYLSQNNIPFEVKASTPFTDRERFDVVLDGHRCDLKSYLISRREQITEIRNNPATLMDAPALVPSDSHAGDGHSYNDLYLFAFMSGLVASSQEDLQKVVSKNQPHYLVHTMPSGWSKPQNWIPLGALTLKSESAEELIVEISGQDEERNMKRRGLNLPPGVKVKLDETFYSITSLHIKRLPDARIGIRSERIGEAHIVAPHEWGNIWVYGMDIFLTGWMSREEFRRRAYSILPGARVFQYDETRVKNLAVNVRDLRPLGALLEKVKAWESKSP